MKAIVILADTINRHCLNAYGESAVKTPNIDRLAKRSVVFDSHWSGSLPCMPARRDLLTGRLHFLERNWGPIEPFDDTLPQVLRRSGVVSHMVTDHYHYLETGGENYCQQFDTWECFRGQELDPLVSKIAKPEIPSHYGKYSSQYALNRTLFTSEAHYTTPKTFQAAADWLDINKAADDFLLWVECFDPHEPFDLPQEYLDMYQDDYQGPLYDWPDYKPADVPEDAQRHIRNRYAGLLTMTDRWLGKLLDVLDRHHMWDDTLVIFTTDHGYLLGEHELMGKNYMPVYNEIAHIPLMVHMPADEHAGKRVSALTQTTDIFPTLVQYFQTEPSMNPIHGKSLLPLIREEAVKVREALIYGYFGKNVNVTDGRYTYFRAAVEEGNSPLYLYTAMLTTLYHYYGINHVLDYARMEAGAFLKWTKFPVWKIPGDNVQLADRTQSFNVNGSYIRHHALYDIHEDYKQSTPLLNASEEQHYIELLGKLLREHDAPNEQYTRLGLPSGG